MAQTSMGAFVTLTIGSNDITLDTADAFRKPLVFEMPEKDPVKANLSDVEKFIEQATGWTPSIPSWLQPVINTGVVEIDELLLATTGDLRLKVGISNSASSNSGAWNIIPNVSGFSIKALGFRISHPADPAIVSVSPLKVGPGGSFTIGGTGLANAQSVSIGQQGSDAGAAIPVTIKNSKGNFFLDVTVPTNKAFSSGPQDIFVTTVDGVPLPRFTSQLTISNS